MFFLFFHSALEFLWFVWIFFWGGAGGVDVAMFLPRKKCVQIEN